MKHPLLTHMTTQLPAAPEADEIPEADRALMPADRPWTKQWHKIFMLSLQSIPNVNAACRMAGISRSRAYATRDELPAFAAAWEDALAIAHDSVERRAYQWIMTGVPVRRTVKRTRTKVNDKGVMEIVESEETTTESAETSATLMIFWLKSWMPDRYNQPDRHETTGAEGGPIQIESIDHIDRQIAELTAELAARGRQVEPQDLIDPELIDAGDGED